MSLLTGASDALRDFGQSKLDAYYKRPPVVRVLLHAQSLGAPAIVVQKQQIERLGGTVTPLPDLDSPFLLKEALRHDLLHIVQQGPSLAADSAQAARRLANLQAARLLGLKIVVTVNEAPVWSGESWPLRLLDDWLLTHAERLVCPSQEARRRLRERYPELPEVHFTLLPPHNFDTYFPRQISRRDSRARLGLSPRGRVFIAFGGVHPYKGLGELIPLFGRHPLNAHSLIVAGHPSNAQYAATIEALCKNYDNVTPFLRYIERDEAQYYMQAADLFVMPYKDVPGSGSVMLALSFAKPVVAPAIGAIPDLLTPGCGVLFSRAGAGELRRALIRSLDLDLERAQAEARRISEAHSARRLSRKLLNTYLELFPKRFKLLDEGDD